MRTPWTLVAVLHLLGSSAATADDTPTRGNEVIVIEDAPPTPAKKPTPKHRRRSAVVPEYSDAAIEHNAWERAWLLLDIDETGVVTRLKFLHRPGHDLERSAIKKGLGLAFEPARDADGKRIRSYLIWPLEWPSYWWLVGRVGVVTTPVPAASLHQPCKGSGEPLNLDYHHAAYRDCSLPDLSLADTEPWITRVPEE